MRILLLPFTALLFIATFPLPLSAVIVQGGTFNIRDGDSHYIVEAYDGDPSWPPQFQTSTVNMTGGWVGQETEPDSGMFLYDSSTLNVHDGQISNLNTYHHSTTNIYGGALAIDNSFVFIYDHSTINHYGGFIGLASSSEIHVVDSATLNLNTATGSINALASTYDNSTLNIYNDHVSGLYVSGNSTAHIYGGKMGHNWGTSVGTNANMYIYGTDFVFDPHARWVYYVDPADGFWVSKLTGAGSNGVPIEIWGLSDPWDTPNIHLIPEPTTLTLLSLSSLPILRKRRIRKQTTSP
jgi:hypothetical protein